MKVVKIAKENAQFQIFKALKTNREKRNKEGFIFEGVRQINNAIKYNWPIKAFFDLLGEGPISLGGEYS